jgi:cell division septation protein DedD
VPPGIVSEHFTVLVSSLKDADNAQKLVEQLRAKGYSSRIENLNLGGSGRWNRVLIGTFKNREEALRFASEFNRKERMEGLVIRESQ